MWIFFCDIAASCLHEGRHLDLLISKNQNILFIFAENWIFYLERVERLFQDLYLGQRGSYLTSILEQDFCFRVGKSFSFPKIQMTVLLFWTRLKRMQKSVLRWTFHFNKYLQHSCLQWMLSGWVLGFAHFSKGNKNLWISGQNQSRQNYKCKKTEGETKELVFWGDFAWLRLAKSFCLHLGLNRHVQL